ncbi:polysaccharide biosynthesis tyrosine autokinase [Oculatella sp. LEGE 06141]|uniref:GumC family protein n=1 Tax=Oculatella sp. LEGE 06141 TaxID=1828648 RepID=UPI00187EF763|nr:polysaccharide biosynthesis tyrosine autokinase [Oculatella sp. LEGE 06141]MBE9178828.1 polysaccharide biosynthesis tyrosine autokinase [Oculatella sp. LEGE 06141]
MKAGQQSQVMPPTRMIQFDEGEEGGLDLGQALSALRRRVLLIAGVTTVVAAAAGFKAMTDRPVYQANFEILTQPVTAESQVLSSIPESLSGSNGQTRTVLDDAETKVRVLKSPKVINPVIESLEAEYPNVNYGTIASNLTVESDGQNILTISYQSGDPEMVRAVLMQLSEAYLNYSLDERQADVRQGISFVEEQLPGLQQRVRTLEDQLQNFRQQFSLIDPETQGQQISDQLTGFSEQQLTTQVELRQAQALYADLQRQISSQFSDTTESAASSALSDNARYQQLLSQLLEIDSQIAQESAIFFDTSPNIDVLREQRQNLLPLLTREAQRVQEEVAGRIRELQARDRALDDAVGSLDTKLRLFPGYARQFASIQRDLQIATANLNQFLEKREALRIDAAQRETPWQLLSPPSSPKPSAASVKRNVALGSMLGLLLGMGAALMVDRLSNVVHTSKELKDITRLPLLGIVPFREELREAADAIDASDWVQQANQHLGASSNGRGSYRITPFFESFRSLFANIRLLGSDTAIRSIVVSSAIASEGKSTVSLNLAQAAAAMGQRVLLVDADMRRPQIHDRLGLMNIQGLTNVISSDLDFYTDCLLNAIQQSPIEDNLFVLTAGHIPPDPTRLLSSNRMQALMGQLQDAFDLVIYDAPPILGFADVFLMAGHADGTLFVSGLGKIKRPLLEQALEELRVAGTPILGAVANGARGHVVTSLYGNYQRYYVQDVPNESETVSNPADENGDRAIPFLTFLKKGKRV